MMSFLKRFGLVCGAMCLLAGCGPYTDETAITLLTSEQQTELCSSICVGGTTGVMCDDAGMSTIDRTEAECNSECLSYIQTAIASETEGSNRCTFTVGQLRIVFKSATDCADAAQVRATDNEYRSTCTP